MSNQRKRKVELGKLKIESAIFRAATSFSDQILADVSEMLSIWGITPLQYDALCILYSEDEEDIGLPSKEVGSHLYTRVPDVTRLLDRMVEKGLIKREKEGGRSYIPNFVNNYLTRGLIQVLKQKGFISSEFDE